MAARKVTVIREMAVGDGVGERRSFVEYDDETKQLIRPDTRLTKAQQKKWDNIMKMLSKVKDNALDLKGEDLRAIVDGPGLLDYCLKF